MSHLAIRVHARPELRYLSLLEGAPSLAHALAPHLEKVAVVEAGPAPEGGEHLGLETARADREEILNEIALALQQAGYYFVKAEVSEIVDEAVQWGVSGLLSLGGAAGLKTKNPFVTIAAAALGYWAGREAGAKVQSVANTHLYRWFPDRGWVATLPREAAPAEQQASEPLYA